MADENEPIQTDPSNLSIKPSSSQAIQPQVECKGIRSTSDFPKDLSGLSPEQAEHHYKAMRNSHAGGSKMEFSSIRVLPHEPRD